jgi:predicted  nucleic acid-binding Zn-ribbon protein
MADVIKVPVSFGEVLDKITILEIKSERIADAEKVKNVRLELDELSATWDEAVENQSAITDLRNKLKAVNEELWEIEDDIRDQEAAQDFGSRFIELARAVYVTNDKRAAIKKEVNLALGSRFVEEKSYQDYTARK